MDHTGKVGIGLRSGCADADSIGFPRQTRIADMDVVTAGGEVEAGTRPHGDIVTARGVALERTRAERRVSDPIRSRGGLIDEESVLSDSHAEAIPSNSVVAVRLGRQSKVPDGYVTPGSCVPA